MSSFRQINFSICLLSIAVFSNSVKAENNTNLLEQGRRIYEDGILPNGKLLIARRPEGFSLEGEYAACTTCHRRSGMGSVEGNVNNTVLVPPIAGPLLFSGARFSTIPLDKSHHYVPNAAWERALTRSAYDFPSLNHALKSAIDPDGNRLHTPMPIYDLDNHSLQALGVYLTQLTSQPDPGVEDNALHLATVVTPDTDRDHVEAVTAALKEWSNFARGSGKPWKLMIWKLSGPVETWSRQLDSYYSQRPVFALLSGLGTINWNPVHNFCEKNKLPCILPSIDYLQDVSKDWYSLYYSPGVDLEAGILSTYLQENNQNRIIQLYADSSGKQASTKLGKLIGSDDQNVISRRYHQSYPKATFLDIEDSDTLVLWLRPPEIMQLVTELPIPPAQQVFISSFLSAPNELKLPRAWKDRIIFISMFDDLSVQGELAKLRLDLWLKRAGLADNPHRRLQADAYAAGNLLNAALGMIRKEEIRRPTVHLNREHVIETLENLVYKYSDSTDLVEVESHVAWYGRMSLGPRQRVAVRGGKLLRYENVNTDKLVPVSKRIVP